MDTFSRCDRQCPVGPSSPSPPVLEGDCGCSLLYVGGGTVGGHDGCFLLPSGLASQAVMQRSCKGSRKPSDHYFHASATSENLPPQATPAPCLKHASVFTPLILNPPTPPNIRNARYIPIYYNIPQWGISSIKGGWGVFHIRWMDLV